MREEFIHFLWRFRLFNSIPLQTTKGLLLEIFHPGILNSNAGPDFSAARVKIDNTLWAGNVEIHVNSSDWYRHNHQQDEAYGNIILHVVMHHDMEIKDNTGAEVPVFEVRNYFDASLLHNYERIVHSRSWIPCENFIFETDPFIVSNWLGRLIAERLENKSNEIMQFYRYFDNNWHQTFYYFLARNFGFKVNASPFALLAQKTPYQILARHRNDLTQLEAILFGQAGFLNKDFKDAYPTLLKKEYAFLQHKYSLEPLDSSLWKFGRLRPPNFPTLRIAQFAALIHQSDSLFDKITTRGNVADIKPLFKLKCSPYWTTHYTFDKPSHSREKKPGDSAIENILINTIAPLKFVFGKESMKPEIREQAINLLTLLPPEKNTIITNWEKIGIKPVNAAESQALLELKKYYCTPKKCLQCAIGHNLIRNNRKASGSV